MNGVVLSLAVLLFSACAAKEPGRPVKINELRQLPPVMKSVKKVIDRTQLREALGRSTDIRLIPVYSSMVAGTNQEYRIFDIRPGSVADLLGLENADVLVAAAGYVVHHQRQFETYLRLMAEIDSAEIEIRRGGAHLLLSYTITPSNLQGEPTSPRESQQLAPTELGQERQL
jgi:type II secretory pathway component PulC